MIIYQNEFISITGNEFEFIEQLYWKGEKYTHIYYYMNVLIKYEIPRIYYVPYNITEWVHRFNLC